ncbi:MAG: hypothetical protein KDC27_07450 [Acidobacteria bacterium]|nr:hypothetical protein [Acidobacteriota bacterium]
MWRKQTLHPVTARALYRFDTCSNGLTYITSNNGDFLAIGSDGSFLADSHEDELADTTAMACDPPGRLLAVTKGWLKIFDIDPHAKLTLSARHWIAGGPGRLFASPDGDVYVVGLAVQDGRHVFLRRFRLSDGEFLGVPDVRMPFSVQDGLNSFAVNGSMAWNAGKSEAVYVAANPALVWRLRGDTLAGVSEPDVVFENAEWSQGRAPMGGWQNHDAIRTIAALPDGSFVAQVFRGKGNPPPAGESFAYLFVLDEDYASTSAKISLPAEPFLGMLSGADSDGNLYFVDLKVDSVAKVNKVRLPR